MEGLEELKQFKERVDHDPNIEDVRLLIQGELVKKYCTNPNVIEKAGENCWIAWIDLYSPNITDEMAHKYAQAQNKEAVLKEIEEELGVDYDHIPLPKAS